MKKATFIIVTMMTLVVFSLTGCGGDADNKEKTEKQQEQVTVENREIETEIANLTTENQKLKTEVESLTAEKKELESEVERLTNEVSKLKEQLDLSLAQSNKEIRISAFYNGKVITLNPKSTDVEAISNPVDIYQGEYDRDITLLISGISVKNVYVNQSEKIEDITFNETEKVYSIPYYMNGEGTYTFLVEAENGTRYYISVKY